MWSQFTHVTHAVSPSKRKNSVFQNFNVKVASRISMLRSRIWLGNGYESRTDKHLPLAAERTRLNGTKASQIALDLQLSPSSELESIAP
jgi:hypothetical protein